MATNYATIEDKSMTNITVKAGHVNIFMSANNSNYMDLLEHLAKLMCENNPIQLLEKLKSL